MEQTLAGRQAEITQKSIALGFLKYKHGGKRALNDARALASRLRNRLPVYYQNEGQSESIRIIIPKGEFVPTFSKDGRHLGAGEPEVGPIFESEKLRPLARCNLRLIDELLNNDYGRPGSFVHPDSNCMLGKRKRVPVNGVNRGCASLRMRYQFS